MAAVWADDFSQFLRDMGKCPRGYSLDRKDNNGDYEPGNCQWASASQQRRNRREIRLDLPGRVLLTFNGKTQTVPEWARELNLNEGTMRVRLWRGWPTHDVLAPPLPKTQRRSMSPNSRRA
jgi:hypothetical protein